MAERIPPTCPNCGRPAGAGMFPPSIEVEQGEEPKAWWCSSCLHARVSTAYAAVLAQRPDPYRVPGPTS